MKKNDFTKETGKPLDEWIGEDTPVLKNRYDPKTGRVFSSYEIEKVKTKYIEVPYEKLRCKTGDHIFEVADIHKYIFHCTKCQYTRQVYPTTYKFANGKLIHRFTGKAI